MLSSKKTAKVENSGFGECHKSESGAKNQKLITFLKSAQKNSLKTLSECFVKRSNIFGLLSVCLRTSETQHPKLFQMPPPLLLQFFANIPKHIFNTFILHGFVILGAQNYIVRAFTAAKNLQLRTRL